MTTIHTLDHNFINLPQNIATYAIVSGNNVALVETGPASTLNTIREGLQKLGIKPSDVQNVFVTHIHLDHSGAAWWWAQQGATIHVHPNGAAHLIDPSKLVASASRLYKDKMDFLWGEIQGVPENKVHIVHDGDTVNLGEIKITALDTPGHAKHHHAYLLGDAAFTGDVTGVHLPDFDWTTAPTPPPEFDLETWETSLDKLLTYNFKTIYPTHFGAIHNVQKHLTNLRPLVRACAEFVHAKMQEGLTRDQIVPLYMAWNAQRCTENDRRRNAVNSYMGANNQDLSVDGLIRYWTKKSG